tara:strand:+ start:1111 stop:2157 length:1047 start_codon:yes stop_codon:yes gene_type:complete
VTVGLAEQRYVFVSSADGTTVYQVDSDSGKLDPIQTAEPRGLMALSSDQSHAYVAGANSITSYEVQADGKLQEIGVSEIAGGGSYIDLDETDRFLAASHYGNGTVTIWPVDSEGVAQGTPTAHLTLEKKSHSSVFAPGNEFLLVPATEPNKVFQLKFDSATGKAKPNDPPSGAAPTREGDAQQPRHIIFHPNGRIAYTTLERENPGVGVWKWDAAAGSLKVIQNIVTYPEGFDGVITTADLHLTPDAKFLYVSNRDITDRKAVVGNSSIVGFRVDPETGRLSMIGHTPCEQVPRAFAVDQAGEFLYVAGQTAAKLGVYQIDPDSGALSQIEQLDTGAGPNWIRCVTLP